MQQHKDTHLDHYLSPEQLRWLLKLNLSEATVIVKTFTLPPELGLVWCALRGPTMHDEPIDESRVTYAKRGNRPGVSRLVDLPMLETRRVTVVAGPHDGYRDVMYTAFGGPRAPREVYEWKDDVWSVDSLESREFWAEHALSTKGRDGDR